MRTVLSLLLCFAAVDGMAQSKELLALQVGVRKVIDEAEPSVACILVSRSDRYRDFNAAPNGPEGRLGGFDARFHLRPVEADPARREVLRRLDLSGPDPTPDGYGSGVVLSADGLVLTNFHVIQGATKIYVRLPGRKGSYADIHAADGRSDLAVIKLLTPPPDLKSIRVGNGDAVRKGDFVIGLANSFSAGFRDGEATASHGIVGNIRRRVAASLSEGERVRPLHQHGTLLQTDLRLNIGSSGGAVLNIDGEMIGMTTALAAVVGGETPGGFAIPMSAGVKNVIEVLKRGEEVEYGFLGVGQNEPDKRGAVIDQVSEGTPARRAGLQVGEIITAVGSQPVRDYDDLSLLVGTALAGTDVVLSVQNFAGATRKVSVRLSKISSAYPTIASNRPSPVHGLRVDYASAANADVPLPEGVFIRDVEKGSATEKKYKEQLERGRWIITAVNGKAVATPADFYREAAGGGNLELKVVEAVRNPDATSRTWTLP